MLSDELQSIRNILGRLLGKVDPESAETLRLCRRNLESAADDAAILENVMRPLKEGE